MTLETILRTVLHAVAWSAFVAFCGVVATVGMCWMLRLLRHALAETGRRCGKWAAMTLASLALVCGVVAQKANTNAPPDGASAPAPMTSCAMGTIAPPVDSAQSSPAGALSPGSQSSLVGALSPGPQSSLVGALSLGAQSSRLRERPATAQDVPQWELRGAYDDAIRIPAEGWDFRMTNGFLAGLTVFSRGEFSPDVGHLYFPRPFTNDLAFLPQSKWELLPDGGFDADHRVTGVMFSDIRLNGRDVTAEFRAKVANCGFPRFPVVDNSFPCGGGFCAIIYP